MTRALTMTRLAGPVLIGSRAAAAKFANRHESLVRRYCKPIACDVTTRADLYDLDATAAQLGRVLRRYRRVA